MRLHLAALIVVCASSVCFAVDLPVKEITVFKDGHALLLHQGEMPVERNGNVVLDRLPAPVLGTFWPYSNANDAKLSAVTAGQDRITVERTALQLRELIEANIGATVVVTEMPLVSGPNAQAESYDAVIEAVPTQGSDEIKSTSPPDSPEALPRKGNIVLLRTGAVLKAVNIERIVDISFKNDHKPKLSTEEMRNRLTLKLEWPQGKMRDHADVGLMYVQKGIRWIPNYKITIDGNGNAIVQLHATLLNEITDLNDVTAHLVIGAPSFYFADTTDPIALQQQIAQLSPYFQQQQAQAGAGFSNAIMAQTPRMSESRAATPAPDQPPGVPGPEIGGSEKNEDLFIFTVNHITLKKGERMVVPVTQFTLPYKDVYTLDLPFSPPPAVWQQFDSERQYQIAMLLNAPKVMHKIRLTNKSQYPLTTAPALIVRGGSVLAQGMMTYTAVGGESDVDLTAAVDVKVKKSDKETGRDPNAIQWNGDRFERVNLDGTISLTHFGNKAIDVEITRHVLGNVAKADHDGQVAQVNLYEDDSFVRPHGRPYWWGWYSWPVWWNHFNGVGRITWNVTLQPSATTDLKYSWYYVWR